MQVTASTSWNRFYILNARTANCSVVLKAGYKKKGKSKSSLKTYLFSLFQLVVLRGNCFPRWMLCTYVGIFPLPLANGLSAFEAHMLTLQLTFLFILSNLGNVHSSNPRKMACFVAEETLEDASPQTNL